MSTNKPKTETVGQSKTADDILADLMNDLQEVDRTVIGFDASQVSEEDPPSESEAPDNLDLNLDSSESVDGGGLFPGLTSLENENEEEYHTVMTSVSVSLHQEESLVEKNNETGVLKKPKEVSSIFKNLPEGTFSSQKFELEKNHLNLDLPQNQVEPSEQNTSIFTVGTSFDQNAIDLSLEPISPNRTPDAKSSDPKPIEDDVYEATSIFGSSQPDEDVNLSDYSPTQVSSQDSGSDGERTIAISPQELVIDIRDDQSAQGSSDSEKTLAVAGYSQRQGDAVEDKVKISVGQVRGNAASSGYAAWGSSDSNLVQAENLRMAQDKIIELEKENERLRSQNEDLISASEIVKERADLLTNQLHEYKNDRESLEQSFRNEASVLKKQIERKESDLLKVTLKAEELDSKIRFDLKKIRIRERELENRLELVRAEKNALVKSKDENILDLKRKLDQAQLEVESYRQKCVDLNKVIDANQDSFKRTNRALRLAMANLELQEESKPVLKKAE